MRTSKRSGMFETEIPPAPCGLIAGIEPKIPDEALGSLGFTDATSKRTGAAAVVVACADAFVCPMPRATTTHTTRGVFIRSILLSYS